MCGIAGIIAAVEAPPPDAATLGALGRGIAHRGPDGSGQSVVGRVGLVHHRLAITDLVTGGQPLFAGSAALVADGAIGDFRESPAGMPGAAFATPSRGMYAIAIHDRAGRTVTLARDPFGIKPLYIAQTASGIAFASEAGALLGAGIVPRAVRPAARDELLQIQFTTGAETIFPGIRRVLPGETLTCADGRIIERHRAEALPEGPPESIDEAAALARLDRALTESVDLHRRADVPCGMFLSGGIDSAAILTLMARLGGAPVPAFTAWFGAPGAADERDQAGAIARALGARHETLEITEAMVWRHLPDIVAGMDDPAADYAIIPTWFLARRARDEVKVVLSGEGGDEIFAGHGRYRSAMRPWWLGGRVMRARGTFDRLDVLRARPPAWRDGLAAAEAHAASDGRSRLQVAQAIDVADWLPHDLLLKLDRCLMAHAVEGRTPFLDPAVAGAAFRLPDGLKVRGHMGKWLLRTWLGANCPAARAFAPKRGFTVPVGAWIGGAGDRLGPLVAAQPGVAEIAEPARVLALFRHAAGRREQYAAWHLLFYALWHRAHIEGRKAEGDVFDYLAAR